MAAEADAGDLTVEDVSLAGVEGAADVALVEKGQVELAGVVHSAAFGDLHAGTEVAGAERLGDEGGDGSGGVGGEDGDAFPEGAVLVVPGEVGQQVGGGVETQLGQGGGAGGADAVKFCEEGVQGDGWFGHGRGLLSVGCRFIVEYGAEKRKNFSEVARFHATWRGVEGRECKEVGTMRKRNVDRKAVLQQMMALAAGRANDAVKLAYLPEEALETLSRLDLGCLTEFKRSSNGAVEVKLTDRAAVLVKLLEQLKDAEGTGTAAFLEALDRGGEKGGGTPA